MEYFTLFEVPLLHDTTTAALTTRDKQGAPKIKSLRTRRVLVAKKSLSLDTKQDKK